MKNILGNPIDDFYSKERIDEVFKELSPDNCFIIIDTPYEISSSFLTNSELNYTKNFNYPYKMNNIPDELLEDLKNIKSIGSYEFKPREKNEDYTKLENLTEEPCYKISSENCKYNEYDPNVENMEPYVITDSDIAYSILKIDRSFGIPFVKGFIDIYLDENMYDSIVNSDNTRAQYYLLLYYLNYKFQESSLYEAGTTIGIDFYIGEDIIITFSTYNDLVDKVIEFIIDCLQKPIDEIAFNRAKELFILSIADKNEDTFFGLRYDIIDIFKDFKTAKTYESNGFNMDIVKNIKYNELKVMQKGINDTMSFLYYMTYGDISLELAQSTTEKLYSLIKQQDLTLLLNQQQFYDIPEKTSLFYTLTSDNIYQRQGGILVMYEFDVSLYSQMNLYTICVRDIIFNYIREERGSGYVAGTSIKVIYDKTSRQNKYYLSILCLGKVYSPEKMDRLINEAIKESFSYNFPIDSISKYLEEREQLKDFPEEKYYDLIDNYAYGDYSFQNLEKDEENLTYKKIIEDIKDVLVNKPKRISILYHRGDITEDELEKQKKELDKHYYLNPKIRNIVTDDIQYLKYDHSSDNDEYAILLNNTNFVKPNNFLKQYEFIQLRDSEYKFFLVHDPKTLTAGIEFRTKFGYTTDIIDGFANYAENVFFEGTEEISEYNLSNLVDQYDEFNDAETSYEEAVFQFFGAQNTFNTMLDYVSKFIKNPILNETKFMTAINTITSEHDGYNNSRTVKYDILMENANPEHGFSQTTTGHIGDNKTLGIHSPKIIRDYLKNYFRTIFKPENCVFLLYSSLSLEEMRNYTLKYFNFNLENPSDEFNDMFNKKVKSLNNPIYTKDQLGKFVVYNGLREIPTLMIEFQISQKNKYIDASTIMSYLLNGKKEGSLQHFLLKNNYISEMIISNEGNFRNYQILELCSYLKQNKIYESNNTQVNRNSTDGSNIFSNVQRVNTNQ